MSENVNLPNPSKILQVGMGYWGSKTLLTAVGLELFTLLGNQQLHGNEIKKELDLHDRSLYDFLDALVALGFLERSTGIRDNAVYQNTPETSLFLDKNSETYIGGILEMSNTRLFRFWNGLEKGLKTGEPQNEVKFGDKPVFETLYATEESTREFIDAMAGIQMANFMTLAKTFDFSPYTTHCDLGGSGAHLSMTLSRHQPHLRSVSFDLPAVTPIAQSNIDKAGLSEQVTVASGDFFNDQIPRADIITMGNILHDWNLEEKKNLIAKVCKALNEKGCLIVIENVIDDERRNNAFGLLMSLNMLIETPGGFDYSAQDFDTWARECGFIHTKKIPLTGPSSALIAYKS
ncbi:acetylserotonin O-methyltransferase [Robertkochia flava]|uniref:acetylserotonin O-methyltransferase n=1 Tax=Robertkochia flava TaxID=3447986 RepID=UPI001CCDA1EE|nr:acetylserotonin O-methyltransferase [Robertkochia marina]